MEKTQIQLLEAFDLVNSTGDKQILSMVEKQVKKIIFNNDYLTATRLTMTAESINTANGYATGIYRIPERMVYGTDFDPNNGAELQDGKMDTTSVNLDQYITIKYMLRKFDLSRLSNGGVDVAASVTAEWAASLVTNALMNYEAMFLESIKNYYILRYAYGKSLSDTELAKDYLNSVLVIDLKKLVKDGEEEAKNAFYKINDLMIDKIQTVDANIVGTNKADWEINISMKAMAGLTRAYTNIINSDISANTLANGSLFNSTILGTKVYEHMFIGTKFDSQSKKRLNKNTSYDLTGFDGFALHKDNFAFPMGFAEMMQVVDNNTGQPKIMGRSMLSVPSPLRGQLGFIIMDTEPTQEQIDKAKTMVWKPGAPNMTTRIQLASWDGELANIGTKPEQNSYSANYEEQINNQAQEIESLKQAENKFKKQLEEALKEKEEMKKQLEQKEKEKQAEEKQAEEKQAEKKSKK